MQDDRRPRRAGCQRPGGQLRASYFSDRRKRYLASVGFSAARTGSRHLASADLELTVQPTPTFSFVVGPSYFWSASRAQYVTTRPDPLATATYQARYVFANLEQRELALVSRISWTLHPAFGQFFAQPLLASGRYHDFKELTTPRRFDFTVYGRDAGTIQRENGTVTIDPDGNAATGNTIAFPEPNFSFASLRGNAVLRWEYRPGSTLFVVWQQRREDEAFRRLRLGRDLSSLFHAPSEISLREASFWMLGEGRENSFPPRNISFTSAATPRPPRA